MPYAYLVWIIMFPGDAARLSRVCRTQEGASKHVDRLRGKLPNAQEIYVALYEVHE